MTRLWKPLIAMAALCVAMAALTVGASAAKPQGGKHEKTPTATGARVDKTFGSKGLARIATGGPNAEQPVRMALSPSGTVYALEGNLLLAFGSDGKPLPHFGNKGRLRVESTRGELKPTGLAVDSQGHVLVSGTITKYPFTFDSPIPASTNIWSPTPSREAFVDRYLENGTPDPSFGDAGEADTTFGLPRPTGEPGKGVEFERAIVEATTLAVDPEDRPVIGGGYVNAIYYCAYGDELFTAFVARLTVGGAVDPSYAGKGYVAGPNDEVQALARTGEGGVSTLNQGTTHCSEHGSPGPSTFDTLTVNGDQSPLLVPARPALVAWSLLAVDSKERSLLVKAGEEEGPATLLRLLPSGAVDTSFGFGGGIPLKGDVTSPGAIAVDAKNRTLVAQSGIQHPYGPRLARYTAAGKRDWTFGVKGLLSAPVANDSRGGVSALAIDAKGRIYAAGWVESKKLKTGHGIQIVRFLPGS